MNTMMIHSFRMIASVVMMVVCLSGGLVTADESQKPKPSSDTASESEPANSPQLEPAWKPTSVIAGPGRQGWVWVTEYRAAQARSTLAQSWQRQLDELVTIDVSGNLDGLTEVLREKTGLPVFLDSYGLQYANPDSIAHVLTIDVIDMPLRSVLRQTLAPIGLKAEVDDDGLLITADTEALARGIGTHQWFGEFEEPSPAVVEALAKKISLSVDEITFKELIRQIRKSIDVDIQFDPVALEEVGFSMDRKVSFDAYNVSAERILKLIARRNGLALAASGPSITITTVEEAEANLIGRIYWLDGLGGLQRDFQSIIDTIQCTIMPETWEALGGPSTMRELPQPRPALVVSTTYRVHQEIESLLKAIRHSHFGRPSVATPVQVPPTPKTTGRGMGGGDMGGGGMF